MKGNLVFLLFNFFRTCHGKYKGGDLLKGYGERCNRMRCPDAALDLGGPAELWCSRRTGEVGRRRPSYRSI
jgi:hypothetical protein